MTTLVDSEAHFEGRLRELGLAAGAITAIKNHGVSTLSQLAFAVGQPGQPLLDGTIDNFLQGAFKQDQRHWARQQWLRELHLRLRLI